MTINIFLARHGETIFNVKEYIQGQSDAPLTKNGVEGAVRLGNQMKDIHFDYAIASDLRRAIKTRDIILKENVHPNVPTALNPKFGELHFGEHEGDDGSTYWSDKSKEKGLDFYQMGKEDIFAQFDHVYHPETNTTAERGADFKKRIIEALQETLQFAKENQLENILVVSHGLVVMGIIQLYNDHLDFNGNIYNASVTKLVYDGERLSVEYIGRRDNID